MFGKTALKCNVAISTPSQPESPKDTEEKARHYIWKLPDLTV